MWHQEEYRPLADAEAPIYTIARATPDDLDGLVMVNALSLVAGAVADGIADRAQVEQFLQVTDFMSRKRREREALLEGTLVAQSGTVVPIGFIACNYPEQPAVDGCVEIEALYVLPEYWRCGVASGLVRDFVTDARIKGATRIAVWTTAGSGAVTFYKRSGWTETGHTEPGPPWARSCLVELMREL